MFLPFNQQKSLTEDQTDRSPSALRSPQRFSAAKMVDLWGNHHETWEKMVIQPSNKRDGDHWATKSQNE